MAHDRRLPIDPDLDPTDPGEPGPTHHARGAGPAFRRADPAVLAAVAAGGMVGASARYGIARWSPVVPGQVPWATLWTNLGGSLVLGVVLVLVLERSRGHRLLRPFLATGAIGAFTTMSTYAVEVALLVRDDHPLTGAVYAVASLIGGVVAAAAGLRIGRRVPEAAR